MSIEYLNYAFKCFIKKSSTKFVFVALADYANEVGEAYPSIETLCRKTSLNRKTVIAALKELRAIGVICDTGLKRGETKQVKVWQIFTPKGLLLSSLFDKSNSTENGTVNSDDSNSTENGTVPFLPENSTENGTVKPSQKRDTEPSVSLTISEPPDSVQIPTFDDFYNAYGNKKKRIEAERAWKKLDTEEKIAAVEAIPAFDKSLPDYHDKPLPASYLNGKRWTDDLDPWTPPVTQGSKQPEQYSSGHKSVDDREADEAERQANIERMNREAAEKRKQKAHQDAIDSERRKAGRPMSLKEMLQEQKKGEGSE